MNGNKATTPITIADVTQGTLGGKGAFDIVMQTMKVQLVEEYSSGRITGDAYAQAYISMANLALTQSVQFVLNSATANKSIEKIDSDIDLVLKNIELADAKINTEQAQIADTVDGKPVGGIVGQQVKFYAAQTKGFKDNSVYKLTKLMTDAFAVQRGTDESFVPPSQLSNPKIDEMVLKAIAQITH